MRWQIVRLANWAHRQPTIKRRFWLVLAVALLALNTAVFWAFMPVLMVLYPLFAAVKGFVEAVQEMPALTIGSVNKEFDDWRRDGPGIGRIWRAQKDGRQ